MRISQELYLLNVEPYTRTIVEQAFNTALAVLHLTNRFEKERIERASDIALAQVHTPRYRHLNSILSSKTDQDESKRIQSKAEAAKGILKGREYFENFGGGPND